MGRLAATERRRLEALSRSALRRYQLERLQSLLRGILPANRFYAEKLADVPLPPQSLDELNHWPYTYKEELQVPQGGEPANLTFPLDAYVRYHQTSGTRGRPLVVLDTQQDWQWWLDCWQYVLDAAGVEAGDRVCMAFSFGPFIGFWSCYEAAAARGSLVIPAGGMNTLARLELLRASRATVLCCTPSYALHMAEVAAEHNIVPAELAVRVLILAGEPGGSVPSVRQRLQQAWQADVIDHSGASEVGPWGYGDSSGHGLHVLESEFIAEFLSVGSGEPAREGELAELVLTTLGRAGAPVIRYRTGDLVRPRWQHGLPCQFVLLEGGVVGRADDMLVIRGVNVFPSAVDQILRSFPEVLEYRVTVQRRGELDHLHVEVEDRLGKPQRIADEFRVRLGLKVDVVDVPLGTLPRFEGKGRRFLDQRAKSV
ncbi:MAG: phenylacetate--CoA ligase family protein [Pirellulales bacterium]|nr:phenylacetate--CoA ligase family protein [Pirellulales bacterium]